MDSNGYNKSLFGSEDGISYWSLIEGQTVRHEVFNGRPYRKYSKEDGLWVALTPQEHEQIHKDKREGTYWNKLQREGEKLWLLEDWSRSVQDFVDRYGRNYL